MRIAAAKVHISPTELAQQAACIRNEKLLDMLGREQSGGVFACLDAPSADINSIIMVGVVKRFVVYSFARLYPRDDRRCAQFQQVVDKRRVVI